MVNELIYPQNVGKAGSFSVSSDGAANTKKKPGQRNTRVRGTAFSQVLKMSVEKETTNKGWCNTCHRYQTLATRRTIHEIPSVLMLTTAIHTAEHRHLWATPGWLPEEIGIIVDNGNFFCYEGEDLKLHLQRGIHNITVYSLTGLAVNIDGGKQQQSHLVAMANSKYYLLLYTLYDGYITEKYSCTFGTDGAKQEPMVPIQRFSCQTHSSQGSINLQHVVEDTFGNHIPGKICQQSARF